MRKLTLILLFLALPFLLFAQTLRRPVAANYIGIGAYSLSHIDVFSFTANQASLAQLSNLTAGLFAERRFLLGELNHYNAAFALPTTSGNFGLKAGYFGFNDYNETQIGLAYGRKMGKKVDIGAQFNYNGIRVTGYGSASAISFEAGAIMHISEKLHAGLHINNPVGGKFSKTPEQEKLPSVYSFGMGYEASEKFFIGVEMQKEENQPVNVNAGFQYKIIAQLMARAGVNSATSSYYAGIGVLLRTFRLDVTTAWHPQLGFSPGLMLIFNSNKKEQ
jgi:hypothetical protein